MQTQARECQVGEPARAVWLWGWCLECPIPRGISPASWVSLAGPFGELGAAVLEGWGGGTQAWSPKAGSVLREVNTFVLTLLSRHIVSFC